MSTQKEVRRVRMSPGIAVIAGLILMAITFAVDASTDLVAARADDAGITAVSQGG